ncbi:hypothetical protein ACJIZ3_004681 [Penstemon smallii]|uniref:Uncharacterized protein n=1 Tax=Penstemon smallii TaxID=265156 RepID=A0ABD3S2R3_9LAMI
MASLNMSSKVYLNLKPISINFLEENLTTEGLLGRDIIFGPFFFNQFCNIIDGCIMRRANVSSSFCLWILKQEYMSLRYII